MAAKDVLGKAGEDRAARHLESSGYLILERNWRVHAGEIDIIAVDGSSLVIVEVKTRAGDGFGHPFEAVDARKRSRLWRLAFAWIAAHPDQAQGRRLRLDVIAITGPLPERARLEHIQDIR
ncbi:MAG: YraN family protein [Microbacterium pygmaeum]